MEVGGSQWKDLHKNTRERPTMKLVEPSINKHTLDAIHKHHITNGA